MSILSEQAVKKFSEGFNCAQVVLSAFSEKYWISQADAYKIATGFGGGARNGELCGAVTGAIMVIGLKYGNSALDEGNTKLLCYQKTTEFTKLFQQRKGSIVCRELLSCDIGNPDGMKYATEQGLFQQVCPEMIKETIALLEELGY